MISKLKTLAFVGAAALTMALAAAAPAKAGVLINAVVAGANQANQEASQAASQAVGAQANGGYVITKDTAAVIGNSNSVNVDTTLGDCDCFANVGAGALSVVSQANVITTQAVGQTVSALASTNADVTANAIAIGNSNSITSTLNAAGNP